MSTTIDENYIVTTTKACTFVAFVEHILNERKSSEHLSAWPLHIEASALTVFPLAAGIGAIPRPLLPSEVARAEDTHQPMHEIIGSHAAVPFGRPGERTASKPVC